MSSFVSDGAVELSGYAFFNACITSRFCATVSMIRCVVGDVPDGSRVDTAVSWVGHGGSCEASGLKGDELSGVVPLVPLLSFPPLTFFFPLPLPRLPIVAWVWDLAL